MAVDLVDLASRADASLRQMGDPERVRATAGYFPTEMEILGVSAPKMRSVLKEILAELGEEPPGRVLGFVRELRGRGTHEGRQVAFEVLDRRKDARALLELKDIQELGEGNDNWASVDAFCAYVSGPAWREGQVEDREILRWARSEDRWWRRTALVSTVPLNMKSRGGEGDPGRTLRVCLELAGDTEPMVAKGLSWALRALIAVDRAGVEGFLRKHDERLPALVKREVRNKLETGKKTPGKGGAT